MTDAQIDRILRAFHATRSQQVALNQGEALADRVAMRAALEMARLESRGETSKPITGAMRP